MTYSFREFEHKCSSYWERTQTYKYAPNNNLPRDQIFSIDTPPPTVSGILHIGHIYSYTQTDVIARYQRMRGKEVFFPIGFDDNGLPTERLVEKALNIKAKDLPRHEFTEKCYQVIEEYEKQFESLFRSVGFSYDWSLKYQTISRDSVALSQMSFIDLYNQGLIYQKEGCTFWDTVDGTALAQAELEDRERQSVMHDVLFTCENGAKITIATTRPELIAACIAIFFNPNDTRYSHLANEYAYTPLYQQKVPILKDEDVQMDKGTGLVMCCTFGDIQDTIWWRKHKLPHKTCIEKNGKMKNAEALDGMYVKDARTKIVALLDNANLITTQSNITQNIKCAERSGAPVEILVTKQWYIRVMDIKKEIIENSRKCTWYPDYMSNRLEDWTNGLYDDWCISRQRYFGVPFPVWYSKKIVEEGKIILPNIEQCPVDPMIMLPDGYTQDEVSPEIDVMDTWATSAITPHLAMRKISSKYHLPNSFEDNLYPFDLRPQAHEIIRVWTFGTIVKAMLHLNMQPWQAIMISGWCLATDKSKMSKSKGNVIDPVELISTYGADVVRYWATSASFGTDIVFSRDALEIGKKLVNKLWNVSKLCQLHFQDWSAEIKDIRNLELIRDINYPIDQWLIFECNKTLERYQAYLDKLDYFHAKLVVEKFFWSIFCDNYIELVKKRLYQGNERAKESGRVTIYYAIYCILEMFAPFLPYITEVIYAKIYLKTDPESLTENKSIHRKGSWLSPKAQHYEDNIAQFGDFILEALKQIREFKTKMAIAMNKELSRITIETSQELLNLDDLQYTANTKDIQIQKKDGIFCNVICEL